MFRYYKASIGEKVPRLRIASQTLAIKGKMRISATLTIFRQATQAG
ncbi:hypothetical protein OG361_22145 [Streptomyces sp. NBC_00090]